MHRDAQVIVIIGRNGTGKSTYCAKIIKSLKQRALVVTYNGAPKIWRQFPEAPIDNPAKMKSWKKGIKQVIAARYEESARVNHAFEHIYKNFNNGLLIFDDARGYINSNVDSNPYFRKLLLDFRHKMLDIVFVVHQPGDVPPRVWGFASSIFVGSTRGTLKKSNANLDPETLDRVNAALTTVNAEFLKRKSRNDASHYGLFKLIRV